jgi:polysaccharide biosynthesis/export protein
MFLRSIISNPTILLERFRRKMFGVIILPPLLILACGLCLGQDQRPALIPSAQGGASASAAAAANASVGGLTDSPIAPGQVVHVTVFNAPDFSLITRVSENGDIAMPMLGVVHLDGLNSAGAADLLAQELKSHNLMLDPHITVTVDSSSTGITVLGEVHAPGIYPPPGKHQLSDVLALAGGLTANTGRVIEISNDHHPDQKSLVPWDPTMHNTASYDRPVEPGDRVLVRACGIAYIGGHVVKPGAYSLCGSPQMTLSEIISLAGGVVPLTSDKHTYLVRAQPDGTRIVQEIDLHKVLLSRASDPLIKEDDIVYVTPSTVKDVLNRAMAAALTVSTALLYTYHP